MATILLDYNLLDFKLRRSTKDEIKIVETIIK